MRQEIMECQMSLFKKASFILVSSLFGFGNVDWTVTALNFFWEYIKHNNKMERKVYTERFYDSDEGIAWGPPTLQEIKSVLSNKCNGKPTRTQSLGLSLTTLDNRNDDSIPNISEYLTASEKNEETAASSHYTSVAESNLNTNSCYFSTVKEDNFENTNDFTRLNFIANALNRTKDDVDDIYQTLVDSTDFITDTSVSSEGVIHEKQIETGATTNDLSYPKSISPPISIPEKDIHQFIDESEVLDTTFDRINAILQETANISLTEKTDYQNSLDIHYSEEKAPNSNSLSNIYKEEYLSLIPEETNYQSSIEKSSEETDNYSSFGNNCEEQKAFTVPKSFNIISGSFMKNPENKIKEKEYPVHKQIQCLKTGIPVLKSSNSDFRNPKVSNKNYKKCNAKDIVSPVRMYINYSPSSAMKHNVSPSRECRLPLSKSGFTRNKENASSSVLPKIMYKPSKKHIIESETKLHLPGSLDKFVTKAELTKHSRIPRNYNYSQVRDETFADTADLTTTSSENYNLDNVSILCKKTALK